MSHFNWTTSSASHCRRRRHVPHFTSPALRLFRSFRLIGPVSISTSRYPSVSCLNLALSRKALPHITYITHADSLLYTSLSLHINIGPNLSPITPPAGDPGVAVLAIEPNTAIAHHLRVHFQKKKFPNQFFVLSCAVGAAPATGALTTFHYYNANGQSSSLSPATAVSTRPVAGWANLSRFDPSDQYGPGPAGIDIVAVLSLNTVLAAIPANISIDFLMTDAQGHDLAIIKSASVSSLRRVAKIKTETYLAAAAGLNYDGVHNDLSEWVPYMKAAGYRLTNPPKRGAKGEYDAVWVRIGK